MSQTDDLNAGPSNATKVTVNDGIDAGADNASKQSSQVQGKPSEGVPDLVP